MGHAVGRGNTGAVLGQGRPDPLALSSPGVFFDDAGRLIICNGYRCGAPGALPNSGGCRVLLGQTTVALFAMAGSIFGRDTVPLSQRGPGSSRQQLVRTRKNGRSVGSSLREGGGAVALLVELLSVHPNLPSAAPLASYRESET